MSNQRNATMNLTTVAHSMLMSLPVELLHNILSGLDTASVLNVRLTCRLLFVLGLDHFGDEIPLVFHRDKFRALTEIAAHAVLAKRMRSLYYAGDIVSWQEWHEWYTRRSPEAHYRHAVMEFPTEVDLRSRISRLGPRRARSAMDMWDVRSTAHAAAFGRFNALCIDQVNNLEEKFDTKCLRIMFEGCLNLREVTLAFRTDDGGPQRRLKASRTAFAEAMTVAHRDSRIEKVGKVHLIGLAQALRDSGRSLDGLTVVNVDYSALCADLPELFQLRALVQRLRRLRVFIQLAHRKNKRHHGFTPDVSIFTEAPELRVLKIRLPDRALDHQQLPSERTGADRVLEALLAGALDINHVFEATTYPHLYDLSLANCIVCGNTFIDFILRHRPTLRRLSLQNMRLAKYRHVSNMRSWPDVFSSIAGRLPKLHNVAIRDFFFERFALVMNWCMPLQTSESAGIELICPAREAIENFILMGSTLPWGQILRGELDLLTPRWEPKGEGYVAPGIPDDDRPLDDPAREYEEDEFDV